MYSTRNMNVIVYSGLFLPCGHPANADKSQLPPCETHKEMTETNSHYSYRKGGHFPAPKRDISLIFSLAIANT